MLVGRSRSRGSVGRTPQRASVSSWLRASLSSLSCASVCTSPCSAARASPSSAVRAFPYSAVCVALCTAVISSPCIAVSAPPCTPACAAPGTAVCPAPLAAGGDGRKPDQVELVNGTKLDGIVVYQDPVTVILRSGSRDREIAMKEVAAVRSRAGNLRTALERWDALAPSDLPGLLGLSDSCRKLDLGGEADLLAWKALLLDPRSEPAHLALGHKPSAGGWLVRTDSRSVAFEKLDALRRHWGDAWELETTHYRLRTNVPMRLVPDVALDLEGFYRAFFDRFGQQLRLLEVVEPMGANVHGDQRSYPEAAGARMAWFDARANLLVVNATSGLDRGMLFHEATHGILHSTAERTKSARGVIPGWLSEGLAEYMQWSLGGPSGHPAFVPGALARHHFAEQALAKDPYDLSRVLTFGSDDFLVSSKATLKYAQAYTLVHFCLHGEGGKHEKGFLDFVRGAYLGRASTTDFKAALGLPEKEFEKAWIAYVRATAG